MDIETRTSLLNYGKWLHRETIKYINTYEELGREVTLHTCDPGILGAFKRVRKSFRNSFVEFSRHGSKTWGENHSNLISKEINYDNLYRFKELLNSYIVNTLDMPIFCGVNINDPEQNQAFIQIAYAFRDKVLVPLEAKLKNQNVIKQLQSPIYSIIN